MNININRYVLLALAASFWSLNFIYGKLLVGAIPPSAINLLRWLVAFLVFLPLTWMEIKKDVHFYLSKWPLLLFLALTGYCINGFATYLAVTYTTAINASFIASFNPIIFTLFAFILYREKLDAIQIAGIFISLIGVFWIIFKGEIGRVFEMTVNTGDIIMLLSVISWALYSIVYKKKAGIFDPKPLFTMLVIGGLLTNFILVIFDVVQNGLGWALELNSSHLFAIIILNVFPTFLSFICWNKGILQVGAGEAAIFLNLVPLITTIISILFLGETLLFASVIGGCFIILGVLLVTNSRVVRPYLPFNKMKVE